MRVLGTILFYCLFFVGQQICSAEVHLGVIEGFTWTSANSVLGVYGMYTNSQRNALISTLSSPLNSYFFIPHDDSLSPSYSWSAVEKSQWAQTVSLANSKGINLIMGLRPGYIDSLSSSLSIIENKINTDFIPAGVTEYILAWDDTPGAGTSDQMQLQTNLINSLVNNASLSSDIKLSGVVPAAYYPGAGVDPSGGTWAQKLQILDGSDPSVLFFVTGLEVNPSSLSPSDVPSLSSGREFILWDNWIATDTNTQVTMTFPPNRNPALYSYGYGLNLAFPPERIIHQIKALIASSSSQTPSVSATATQWAQYLVQNSFVSTADQTSAANCLASLMNDGVEDVSQIISQCPLLSKTFANTAQSPSSSEDEKTTSTTSTPSSSPSTPSSSPSTTSSSPSTTSTTRSSAASVVSNSSESSSASSLVANNVIIHITIFMVILSMF